MQTSDDTEQSAKDRKAPPKRMLGALERERAFVQHYFALRYNITKAAMAAGFSENYATAASMGSRLMRRPSVIKLIQAERAKEADDAQERRIRSIAQLEAIAYGDPRQLYDENGAFRPVPELDDHTVNLLSAVKTREELDGDGVKIADIVELKLKDQIRALELLAKVDGQIVERHEHGGPDGTPLSVKVVTLTEKPKGKK